MESSNFNLKASVDNYILLIQNQGVLTRSDAKELTNHLLEAMDDLCRGGLSEEEAFIIATKRLGNEETLTQEYAKVNPSLSTNKVWSYLLIGFNVFYTIPWIFFMFLGGVYAFFYNQFQDSTLSVVIITSLHLLFTCLMIYLVRNKVVISEIIEEQVRKNPFKTVLLSFAPLVVFTILNFFFHVKMTLMSASALDHPMRKFNGTLIEFTYYLAILSIVGALLSLIFSLKKSELISLKSLFEKPSWLFLLCFGILVEVLSASTRTIPSDEVLFKALIFSFIYLSASYLISLYNQSSDVIKYLLIFALFGFIVELSLGFNKAVENGNVYNNVYYCTALIMGVFLGWGIGGKYRNTNLRTRDS